MDGIFSTWPHEQLSGPLRTVTGSLLLEDIPYADALLAFLIVLLTAIAWWQLRSLPKTVPVKRLPKRPALCLLFKPDEIAPAVPSSASTGIDTPTTSSVFRATNESSSPSTTFPYDSGGTEEDDYDEMDPTLADENEELTAGDDDERPATPEHSTTACGETPTQPPYAMDLPDSFAPLLSSSQMEVLRQQLTADLIHAVHAKAEVRMREGSHEIPLDKDGSRPQLRLNVPGGGCRLSLLAHVGSHQFDVARDLDVACPTAARTQPMVKQAGLVFDPPLPLTNVAPTLIHIPTLFEDNWMPTLRKFSLARLIMQTFASLLSLLERCLWVLESKCQIHLSKVRVAPFYKHASRGKRTNQKVESEWRLSLSFSGHVLLFGFLPVPFIGVCLPTFIIPQPHALLDHLLTAEPLASAKLRREHIAEERIVLALLHTAESWSSRLLANAQILGQP